MDRRGPPRGFPGFFSQDPFLVTAFCDEDDDFQPRHRHSHFLTAFCDDDDHDDLQPQGPHSQSGNLFVPPSDAFEQLFLSTPTDSLFVERRRLTNQPNPGDGVVYEVVIERSPSPGTHRITQHGCQHGHHAQAQHCSDSSSKKEGQNPFSRLRANQYAEKANKCIQSLQYKSALEFARKAIEIDPSYVKGYLLEAKCHLINGGFTVAISCYKKAINIEPANTDAKKMLRQAEHVHEQFTTGCQSYENGDYRKTVQCMEMCLQVCHECQHFKLLTAECLAYLRQFQESQKIANDILRDDNVNADAGFILGLCLYYGRDEDKGLENFKKVLQVVPNHKKANDALKKAKSLRQKKEEGNEAFRNGKYKEAGTLYTEALEIDKLNVFTNAKLYYNRAMALVKLSEPEEAIEDYTSAIELDNTDLVAYIGRAESYMASERFEKAFEDFEKISRIGNNQNLSLSQRADYYAGKAAKWIQSQQYKMALVYAQKAIKINPKYVTGYLQEAECHLILGEIRDAINCYTRALRIEPARADTKTLVHIMGLHFNIIS